MLLWEQTSAQQHCSGFSSVVPADISVAAPCCGMMSRTVTKASCSACACSILLPDLCAVALGRVEASFRWSSGSVSNVYCMHILLWRALWLQDGGRLQTHVCYGQGRVLCSSWEVQHAPARCPAGSTCCVMLRVHCGCACLLLQAANSAAGLPALIVT